MKKDHTVLSELHDYSINRDSREIFIHSHFNGEEEGVDYRQAATFLKNLSYLESLDSGDITIHLQSIGGCWNNGMAMFNKIEMSKCHITMIGYAQLSSMSGILFQSADTRLIMPDCHFMLHYGNSGWEQHPLALQQSAALDKKQCDRMFDIFARRAIKGKFFQKKSNTVDSVKKYLIRIVKDKVDWYLTSEEAVFYGFADSVYS